MLKTGAEHLEQLRDGRAVYIGQELVRDVTTHPAFCNGARSIAAIYDMKADPQNLEALSFEEGGQRYSTFYLRARTQEDWAAALIFIAVSPISATECLAARRITLRPSSPACP